MLKNLPFIILFASLFSYSQGITVNSTTYTPEQLLTNVIINSNCGTISNVTSSDASKIGYFNANNSNFPFAEGMILRTGRATDTAGSYTGLNLNSNIPDTGGDADLQTLTGGQPSHDVAYIKFDIVPQSNILSFNFIFASNEYGTYQCNYGDSFAFFLKDLTTGVTTNLAVIPGTITPVSVINIRKNLFNTQCTSVNPDYFDRYNVTDVANSAINMNGQTVKMTAMGAVIPNHAYSLKLVIGDKGDTAFDSAVFIEGGSLALGSQCEDNIQMVAFLDSNANGIKDPEEKNFTYGSFYYQKNNSGDLIQNISSTGTSLIAVQNPTDTFDLTFDVDAQYASFFSNAVAHNDISITAGSGSNFYYFPIVNTQSYNDMTIALIPLQQPRPGFSYTNRIAYSNNGIATASGTIDFIKNPAVGIVSISQEGVQATTNGFSFNFTDLQPSESKYIDVTMQVPSIPTVALGDVLTNTASLTTISDINLSNNSTALSQIIIGSYDPNNKIESHGEKIEFTTFSNDDYLDYTINFQNKGTANAVNIAINDVLDTRLDEQSLRMINSSHDYVLERINNNLVWKFKDIYLPSHLQSEQESQGFVHFKIKLKPGYAIGDVIPNTAAIFFDTNPAIVTNTCQTSFINTLGTTGFSNNAIVLYPNPVNSVLNINLDSTTEKINSLKIIDFLGKVIIEKQNVSKNFSLDVSHLNKGVYIVEAGFLSNQKIIKKLIIN